MNKDLISRIDIKDHISELLLVYSGEELANAILNAINTAETVEPFEPDYVGAERLKARQRGYEDGYHTAMEIWKTLNPKIKQGEWNILQKDDTGIHEIECPFCKYSKGGRFTSIKITFHELPYFCERCGAYMRKDGAENDI